MDQVDPADCNDRSDAESVEAIRPVAVIKNSSMTVTTRTLLKKVRCSFRVAVERLMHNVLLLIK